MGGRDCACGRCLLPRGDLDRGAGERHSSHARPGHARRGADRARDRRADAVPARSAGRLRRRGRVSAPDHRHHLHHRPRRGTVLVAILLVYAFAGLGYGILLAASTGAVLLLHAGISGTPLGLAPADLARDLAGVALAAVAYTAIGVAVGAITRNLLLAAGIVLGWFYLIEPMIMLIPGINTAYPLLPGGATASLVGFTFLTDAMSAQLHLSGPSILSPWVGALVLFVYAAVAAAFAFVLPLRRDIA